MSQQKQKDVSLLYVLKYFLGYPLQFFRSFFRVKFIADENGQPDIKNPEVFDGIEPLILYASILAWTLIAGLTFLTCLVALVIILQL